MSANLLSGVEPTTKGMIGSIADGVVTSSTSKDGWYDVAIWPITADTLAENQTVHMGISLKWHDAPATSGDAYVSVKYANAAGNTNAVDIPIKGITTKWQRFSLSAVVPSGMRVVDFHISANMLDAAYDATNPVLSYGRPVTLASGSVTLYQAASVENVTTWYAAGTTKPNPPTTMEPDGWSQTQPALDVKKTTTLYECHRTVLTDGTYAWGQVSVCSDYEAAKAAYNKAVSLDASLDATGVFNRLTDGGKEQGIYRGDDGHIYINATYIKSGQLTADVLKGGRVVSEDGNVVFDLVTGDIYSFDSDGNGFVLKDGTLQLTTHSIWDSSGDPAYGVVERMSKIFGIDGMTVVGSSGVGIGTIGANADKPVPNLAVGDMSGLFFGGTKDGDAWLNVGQKLIVCFGKVADSSDADDTVPPFVVFGGDRSGNTEAGAVALRNLRSLDIAAEALRVFGSVSMSTPLPIASGGTGATSASAARAALGAASKLDCWPVGSVYISFSTTSPASLFGGTWVRLNDVFLYATAGSSPSTTPVGSHTRTLTAAQMPKHAHGFVTPVMEWGTKWTTDAVNVGSLSSASWKAGGWNGSDHSGSPATATASAGGGSSVNIDPKYLSVFAWRRTA